MKCRFVIEERVPDSYHADASGNNFLFRLMGVEAITVVPAGTNMLAAMEKVAAELASQARKGYISLAAAPTPLAGWVMWPVRRSCSSNFSSKGCRSTRLL